MLNLSRWTPRGRKLESVTSKQYAESVIADLRTLVRETAYNLTQIEAANTPHDESYSRAVALRQQAVDILRKYDPNADEFIARTYQPQHYLYD